MSFHGCNETKKFSSFLSTNKKFLVLLIHLENTMGKRIVSYQLGEKDEIYSVADRACKPGEKCSFYQLKKFQKLVQFFSLGLAKQKTPIFARLIIESRMVLNQVELASE